MSYIGVDIGGTKSAAVLLDDHGEAVARDWLEHHGSGVTPVDRIVGESIERILAASGTPLEQVDAIGVAVAGLISSDQSTIVNAAKLGASHLDLGAALTGRFGRAVFVENDANATLYGHSRHHSQSSMVTARDVTLLLALGTGVGGSIMVNGEILIGTHGFAADLGHVTVDYDDPRVCLCGATGCVENWACGRGVEELAAVNPPPATSRETLGIPAGERITSEQVVALAGRDDPWARAMLAVCGRMLGRAIAVLCITLDPGRVVLGGSFGHAAHRWLLPAARDEMTAHWPFPAHRPLPDVEVDAIGPYAAATGAALMARAANAASHHPHNHDTEEHP